jgi:hypothetical protein
MVTDVRPDVLEEMADVVAAGVTSFKLFTAYPDTNYSDDGRILAAMQRCAELGATVMMHAENGIAIDVLRAQAIARGDTDPIHHLLTRPVSFEAEAVHRAVVLAEVAGCELVIVHISSADALAEAVAGRDRGLPVFAETCPQYLWLAVEDVPDGIDGARLVCSPPLRWRRDGHQDAAVGRGRHRPRRRRRHRPLPVHVGGQAARSRRLHPHPQRRRRDRAPPRPAPPGGRRRAAVARTLRRGGLHGPRPARRAAPAQGRARGRRRRRRRRLRPDRHAPAVGAHPPHGGRPLGLRGPRGDRPDRDRAAARAGGGRGRRVRRAAGRRPRGAAGAQHPADGRTRRD